MALHSSEPLSTIVASLAHMELSEVMSPSNLQDMSMFLEQFDHNHSSYPGVALVSMLMHHLVLSLPRYQQALKDKNRAMAIINYYNGVHEANVRKIDSYLSTEDLPPALKSKKADVEAELSAVDGELVTILTTRLALAETLVGINRQIKNYFQHRYKMAEETYILQGTINDNLGIVFEEEQKQGVADQTITEYTESWSAIRTFLKTL